ncbi:Solute carrier family 35 member C2 [Halotydeus destructor]|nr:Solute carrier family 35 member C2 [Halotydeus destructor]
MDEPTNVHRRNSQFRSFSIVKYEKVLLVALRTAGLVLLYYSFSIGITFYQKWLIKDFHYPLLIVSCHMLVKFMLAALVRVVYQHLMGLNRASVAWLLNWKKLCATGVASALDIGFSNWSFEFITISLYTMTKSTCIIFILGFAILFKLERLRLSLVAVVLLISLGLFMFTFQSTQFKWQGFILVLSASFLGGLRWTMAQLIMQRKDIGLSNPVDMIYYVQPVMMAALFPLAFWLEILPKLGPGLIDQILEHRDLVEANMFYILLGSVFAFLLEMSEYLLLTYTSSLSLSIAGIFKEIITLFLAYEYNGDQMSLINFLGLVICLIGITYHVIQKAVDATGKKPRKRALNQSTELLNPSDF